MERSKHYVSTSIDRVDSMRNADGVPYDCISRSGSPGRQGEAPKLTGGLQPVSAGHRPRRCGVGDRKGAARNSGHFQSSSRTVARITASESDRATAKTAGERL